VAALPDDRFVDDRVDDDGYEGDLRLGSNPALLLLMLAATVFGAYLTATVLVDRVSAGSLQAGPTLIEVPSVAGSDETSATRLITDAGLTVIVSTAQNVQVEAGIVIQQRPRFGERVPAGTEIEIVVSVGDGFARVPDIRGSDLVELEVMLYAHGLRLGDIGYQEDDAEADEVIGQLPAPGDVVPVGGVVHVMASAGPPMIEIPDVRGLAPAEASRLLAGAGFDAEYRDRYSGSVPRGDAMATEPAAGEAAPRGDRIVIYVSRGTPPSTTTTTVPEPLEPVPTTTAPLPNETFAPSRP
jgi:eukaryotic-like serine/threonine-protein kinase